uniref:Uncharacterized protein n=1 Tax=Pelusios castaneus TaxID=367368 RepID=A0A8C8RVG1_9SAUR
MRATAPRGPGPLSGRAAGVSPRMRATSSRLTPRSRLMSALFWPLLAKPRCCRAAFRSATRSAWSGLPSRVTSSPSAILCGAAAGLLPRPARTRSVPSGRASATSGDTRQLSYRPSRAFGPHSGAFGCLRPLLRLFGYFRPRFGPRRRPCQPGSSLREFPSLLGNFRATLGRGPGSEVQKCSVAPVILRKPSAPTRDSSSRRTFPLLRMSGRVAAFGHARLFPSQPEKPIAGSGVSGTFRCFRGGPRGRCLPPARMEARFGSGLHEETSAFGERTQMAGCSGPAQEMRCVLHWFSGWSPAQRQRFLTDLLAKAAPGKLRPLLEGLEGLSLGGPPDPPPSLFQCQLRLWDQWFRGWNNLERNHFLGQLEQADPAFAVLFYRQLAATAGQE